MTLTEIKELLVPISAAISILSISVGILISLRQYRLKARAEIRLAESARVESDIKLLKLFTEIMNIAHARGESVVSDKMLELMLKPEHLSAMAGGKAIDIKDAAVITLPVGAAAQDAAIAAICELGKKHEILRASSLQALESLAKFKEPVVSPYLRELSSVAMANAAPERGVS